VRRRTVGRRRGMTEEKPAMSPLRLARVLVLSLAVAAPLAAARAPLSAAGDGHAPFTIEDVKSYPFPT